MIDLDGIPLEMPATLRPGASVRIVSPDQPLLSVAHRRREAAEDAATTLLGWSISYGEHAREAHGNRSASIDHRVADMTTAFADDSVDAIMCACGGGETRELLPHLDYELIAAHPKTVVGQCANVALSLALLSQARLVSFLGPCFANHLGDLPAPFDETVESLRQATTSHAVEELRPVGSRVVTSRHNPGPVRERTMEPGWRWMRPGHAAGTLIGGDIGTVLSLLDGPYFPMVSGCVLLLDPNALPIEVVELALAELTDAGVLERANGVVFAERRRVDAVEDPDGDMADLVEKWFGHTTIPVLAGGDCGHIDPVWTLGIGCTLTLDSMRDRVTMAPPGS